MKFGGAALETPKHFSNVAEIISARQKEYERIVVVVSAMWGVTDELTALAHQVVKKPAPREMDMLVSAGERISMALLAMALSEKGVDAVSLTGSQSGIITCTRHNNAQIETVRPVRIQEHLEDGKVVIVAGFQGMSVEKEVTTLGRGGSDTSAVALGIALQAEKVEFYKDVSGIYSEDPKKNPQAKLFEKLTFEEALKFETPLHPRSILLASKNGLPLHVISFRNDHPGTWVMGSGLSRGPHYESDRPC